MSVDVREECSCSAAIQVSGEVDLSTVMSIVSEWRVEHRHGAQQHPGVDHAGSAQSEHSEDQGQPTLGFRGAT